MSEPTEPEPAGDASDMPASGADAAREALARAKEAALKSGYRPGQRPRPGERGSPSRRRRSASTDPQFSGPGPDARDPQSIGDSLDELADQQQWKRPLSIGVVSGAWARIVGAEVAAHTTPESVDEHVLVVRADSTAWATELKLLATTITARLTEVVGEDAITQVRVLGPHAPSWKKGPRSVPGRGPRDTYG